MVIPSRKELNNSWILLIPFVTLYKYLYNDIMNVKGGGIMKSIIKVFCLIILILGFSACGSEDPVVEEVQEIHYDKLVWSDHEYHTFCPRERIDSHQ